MRVEVAWTACASHMGDQPCAICGVRFWLGPATAQAVSDDDVYVGEVCPACIAGGPEHMAGEMERRATWSRRVADEEEALAAEPFGDCPTLDEFLALEAALGSPLYATMEEAEAKLASAKAETRRNMDSYAVIMRAPRGPTGPGEAGRSAAVRTINVGGERALAVFASAEAAEDYLLLGGHGSEWEVAAGARESLIGLLRKHAPRLGVRGVVVDPPASLRGGEAPAVAPVPIEEFLDQLEAADE